MHAVLQYFISIVVTAYPQLELFEIDIPYVDKTVQKMIGDRSSLGKQDHVGIEGAGVGPSLLWPNGRVPYAFAAFLCMCTGGGGGGGSYQYT